MRVVMFLTGGAPFGRAWAEAARTAVEVVTVDVLPRGSQQAGVHDPQVVVPRFRLRPKRLTAAATDRVMARRVERALRAIQDEHGPVDVLHSHFYPAARYLAVPSRRLGIPYVHTEHSTSLTPRAAGHKQLSPAGQRVASRALGGASAVIAVSDYLRDCLLQLGLASDPVVIGNPVAVDRFRPVADRRDGTGRLVSVGRLEEDKRPLLLLEAVARARARAPHLRLEMVGDGPLRDAVLPYARRLGIAEAVTLTGQLSPEQVARRVATADAFVTATQVETFGVAIAEAIAAGTPVVAFAVTAVPELVDATTGVLVAEEGGADAMADAVLDVVTGRRTFDPAVMAQGLRRRFAPEAIGGRLAQLYEQVAASGVPGLTPRPR